MNRRFLLEIGVEELPARYIKDAIRQLKENAEALFKAERISFESIQTYSTPRRLTIDIKGLGDEGESQQDFVKGPAARIAYDEEGNPTKALQGFMRGQGVSIEHIKTEDYNGEEYIYATVHKAGKSLQTVLQKGLDGIIKEITFPKSMRWGGKNIRFARPIRWLVVLLDNNPIPYELEGIKAGSITRGHRFLGSQNINIEDIDKYSELLKENYVIVDEEERKDIIRLQAEKLAKEKGGSIQKDEDLLDEVTNLVEYPTPIMGRIKDEYLSLPFDVITTPMKEHLRYFPVLDDKNRLLPYFVTVRNGDSQFEEIVVKGNEKVLGARLEDAKFFYKDDISIPLEGYVEKLKALTFQEKLGTVYDKTSRIMKLAEKIGDYLEVGEETEKNLQRASYLSKADLVTKMVTEFTELQGKIGMEYAEEAGENEIVSLAIYEQYMPRYSGDELPSTTAGAILSIADKLDSICGLFAIGIKPTGSQDPFALRRAALGIINIIMDKKLNISLLELIDFSLYIYVEENGLACDYNKVRVEILEFFIGRVRNIFLETGMPYDVIDSVINTGSDNIYDMRTRVEKLSNWFRKEDVADILVAFNRLSSMAIKTESTEVKRDLLAAEEIQLYDAYNNIEDKVDSHINKKEYDKAMMVLGTLKDPINEYFDKVMVMVDDQELKNNRLALLRRIYSKMIMVCDLTYIVAR
ncbi:glycine--tRNA ligase subunit beta [Gudongella sp. DL1XJH-153]|uniref:glycine--tRNA ligase subunit beta n=1 Tax=Gudongella sp. DL1XJH-153 TaxID=3409804 RepID=UPI003BB61C6F